MWFPFWAVNPQPCTGRHTSIPFSRTVPRRVISCQGPAEAHTGRNVHLGEGALAPMHLLGGANVGPGKMPHCVTDCIRMDDC
jgi:hypothetical protein